jgi:hypothetical protein
MNLLKTAAVLVATTLAATMGPAVPAHADGPGKGYECHRMTQKDSLTYLDGYSHNLAVHVYYTKCRDATPNKGLNLPVMRKLNSRRFIIDLEDTGLHYCTGTLRNVEFDPNVYDNGDVFSQPNVTVDCDKSDALKYEQQHGHEWNVKMDFYRNSRWMTQGRKEKQPNAYTWTKSDIVLYRDYVKVITGWLY